MRVGTAAVAMVLVAEAAVWLLRPRDRPIAAGRRSESRLLHAGPDRPRPHLQRRPAVALRRRPGCAGRGAGHARAGPAGHGPSPARAPRRAPVLGAAGRAPRCRSPSASPPCRPRIAAHERAVDYGISTQCFGSWLADTGKSTAIGAVLAAAGGALLIGLVRRFGRRWWLPGSVAVGAIAAVFVWLAPVVVAPLFNKFTPLPATSRARAQVLEPRAARRGGCRGGVSRRTRAAGCDR